MGKKKSQEVDVKRGRRQMVDIHSHILPEVDDGAKSEEESIKMARIAETEGISQIIATSHYIHGELSPSKQDLLNKVDYLNKAFQREHINIEVFPGSEIYLTPELPRLLHAGEVVSLNNGPYILIEFPMGDIPIYTADILYEVRLLGYKPVIAHPERYRRVIEDPNILKNFIEQGNYVQINSQSITGRFGDQVQNTVEILLKHQMVHFIGTDAHSSRNRSPKIKKALNQMEEWIGKEATQNIMRNGMALIKGEDISADQPVTYTSKKGLLNKIKSIFRPKRKRVYG